MAPRRMLVAAAIAIVVGTACSDATSPLGADPSSSDPPASSTTRPPKPTKTTASPGVDVPEVLDFEAPLLDGGTFRGADVAGTDVAFWFWAPW